jgi:hypothetical protein
MKKLLTGLILLLAACGGMAPVDPQSKAQADCVPTCTAQSACGADDGCGGVCDPGVCQPGYHCADGGPTVHCARNCPPGYFDCNNDGHCWRGLCP